jgi:hypothetical protein
MLAQFFVEGGPGMYPTLLSGFLWIAASVLYGLRPERSFAALLAGLGLLTASLGLLNFALGLVATVRYLERVSAADQIHVFQLGFAESLNNVILVMMLTAVAALILSISAYRSLRATR